ncbi:MAG: hypothetical protein H8E44_27020 [Planctomycetes bacterium]|nr:hypothetical protein [Planctomycetota bacterium]MBL7039198.1 hypothetical protein [Pirellulaceae bacterium]
MSSVLPACYSSYGHERHHDNPPVRRLQSTVASRKKRGERGKASAALAGLLEYGNQYVALRAAEVLENIGNA